MKRCLEFFCQAGDAWDMIVRGTEREDGNFQADSVSVSLQPPGSPAKRSGRCFLTPRHPLTSIRPFLRASTFRVT